MTTDDWKSRIEPHLSSSLRAVSDTITRTETVQSWLQRASMEAAEGLGGMSGLQGEMQGYMNMMADLEESLPHLVTAVDDLTEGFGRVDLNWRPLQPNFSRLYVAFDRDYTVKVFTHLEACTAEAARDVLATVAAALPEGDPFPNRPNVVTGLAARDGHGVGVRVKEHLREDGAGTRRSVTLLPEDREPREDLPPAEAPRALLRLLCSSDG